MSMVYLPKEKILVEADDFTPRLRMRRPTGPRSHAGTVYLYDVSTHEAGCATSRRCTVCGAVLGNAKSRHNQVSQK